MCVYTHIHIVIYTHIYNYVDQTDLKLRVPLLLPPGIKRCASPLPANFITGFYALKTCCY